MNAPIYPIGERNRRAMEALSYLMNFPVLVFASAFPTETKSMHFPQQTATLIKHDRVVSAPTERQRSLLERYVQSWEHKDLEGFVDLLRKDASYRVPPWDLWYDGRDSIRSFFRTVWKSYGSFRLLRTSANRQPAFAVYTRVQTEAIWKAHSIQVLDLDDDAIVSLTKFVAPLGPRMFRSFASPESLAPYDQPTIPH